MPPGLAPGELRPSSAHALGHRFQGLAGRDGNMTGNLCLEKSGGKPGKIMGKVMGTSKILDFYRGYSIFSGIASRKMVIE